MKADTLSILPYESIYSKDILRIANESFGEGYMGLHHLEELAKNDGSFYIAETDGEVAGYCCFLYTSAEKCAAYMKLPELLFVENAGTDGRVCVTKSMAVTQPYKGIGLADILFSACLRDAAVAGLNSAWGSAWKIGDKIPMRRIFEEKGFQIYCEIPLIWYDDKTYRCLICNGPCRCTGVIYYKILGCV